MEKLADKQKRAQSHIWEYRQLATIICALAAGRYQISIHNIETALSAFPKLGKSRREDILKAAKSLLENEDTQGIIKDLVKGFRRSGSEDKKTTAAS
jgi:hypothetical protein